MKLIIKITNQAIYFSPSFQIPIAKTNLQGALFSIKENGLLWCLVNITDWNKSTKTLSLEILKYDLSEIDTFHGQKPKGGIDHVVINKLLWATWASHLSSFQKHSFQHIEIDESPIQDKKVKENKINLKFKASLKDLKFYNGYAIVTKKFKWSQDRVEIRITHPHLLQEYNFIKPFFAAHWKKKTIDVRATILLKNSEVIKASGGSSDLESIDNSLVDVIKLKQIKKHFESPFVKILDKSLFTMDDLFNEEYASDKGNLTPSDFNELFNLFLKEHNVRNAAQLIYLAGRIQDPSKKILITLSPNFGFIFRYIGVERDHFVWELLDSHATYIWSFEKSIFETDQVERLSIIISSINKQGRTLYRHVQYNTSELCFNLVNHAQANSNVKDHFPKWRLKVDALLV